MGQRGAPRLALAGDEAPRPLHYNPGVLQCVAVCCSVLQRVAACSSVCFSVLQRLDSRWRETRHRVCCITTQVCCSVLQRVAEYCGVLQLVLLCVAVSRLARKGTDTCEKRPAQIQTLKRDLLTLSRTSMRPCQQCDPAKYLKRNL